MTEADTVQDAIAGFVSAVKDGTYPQSEHTYR